MKITSYRTSAYKNISIHFTDEISGNLPPDLMTDEERKVLNDGAEPMCCFSEKDGTIHCIPWSFIISIEQ